MKTRSLMAMTFTLYVSAACPGMAQGNTAPLRLPYPQAGHIGKFADGIPGYQPMWVYGVKPNGELLWYRKDTNSAPWAGPKTVGSGWAVFKDVIAAGGNRFYGLTYDGKLLWYQHEGFNDGSPTWRPSREVGTGWGFKHIFSGGDGIIYAIRQDGHLLWYRNTGYQNGSRTWAEEKDIGTGWGDFKDVFSLGAGAIYAVKTDGTLLLYSHTGFMSGDKTWSGPRIVGSGWENFLHIVPVGDGVILAIRPDGDLLRYKHNGMITRGGRLHGDALQRAFNAIRVESWDPPVRVGSGWQVFAKVFALLPSSPDPVN